MLVSLPSELLCEISLSPVLDVADLARLNRCSKALRACTSRALYRRCVLDIQARGAAPVLTALDTIIEHQHHHVRELVLEASAAGGQWFLINNPGVISQLCNKIVTAIERATKLEKFQWGIPDEFPSRSVLKSLHLRKSTLRSLNIGFSRDNEESQFQPPIKTSPTGPGLRSLGLHFSRSVVGAMGPPGKGLAGVVDLLQDFFIDSPALRILRMDDVILRYIFLTDPQASGAPVVVRPTTLELIPSSSMATEGSDHGDLLNTIIIPSTHKFQLDLSSLEDLLVLDDFRESWAPFFRAAGCTRLKYLRCLNSRYLREDLFDRTSSETKRYLMSLGGLEHLSLIDTSVESLEGTGGAFLPGTLRSLTINVDILPVGMSGWSERFPVLENFTFGANRVRHSVFSGRVYTGAAAPNEPLNSQLTHLRHLRSLRTLRFLFVVNGNVSDRYPHIEDDTNALQTIDSINTDMTPGVWPKLLEVCTVYRLKKYDYMKVWKRVTSNDDTWASPVKFMGRIDGIGNDVLAGLDLLRCDAGGDQLGWYLASANYY